MPPCLNSQPTAHWPARSCINTSSPKFPSPFPSPFHRPPNPPSRDAPIPRSSHPRPGLRPCLPLPMLTETKRQTNSQHSRRSSPHADTRAPLRSWSSSSPALDACFASPAASAAQASVSPLPIMHCTDVFFLAVDNTSTCDPPFPPSCPPYSCLGSRVTD